MDSQKSEIQLDLDALAAPSVQINYKGQSYQVEPPSVSQFARIADLSDKLAQIDTKDKSAEALQKTTALYDQIDGLIKEIIPDFKDKKFNFAQIMALFKLVSTVGQPTDKAIAKLREEGIDLTKTGETGDPKGPDSTSSEQSPNSSDSTQPIPQEKH